MKLVVTYAMAAITKLEKFSKETKGVHRGYINLGSDENFTTTIDPRTGVHHFLNEAGNIVFRFIPTPSMHILELTTNEPRKVIRVDLA